MPADKPRVLVVDDEKAYLEDFLSLFSRKSQGEYEILTAHGGEEALRLLEKTPIAVIVSDQRMPGMSGSEFLAKAAEIHPKTVRILLTGYSDIDAVVEAVNKGQIYRYVSKDTPLKELELVIRQGVEKYKMEEANRLLLEAKRRLLKTLALQENLSIVGTCGQQVHQKMESLVMNLFNYVFQMGKQQDEQGLLVEFQKLQGALTRLRELASFSETVGSPTTGMEEADLNLLVKESVEQAQTTSKKAGNYDIQMSLAPVLPKIPIHRYSFQRALKELFENALLFSPKGGGKIRVTTRFLEAGPSYESPSSIQIEIQDNGPGIPATEIPKSFAPFYSSFQKMLPDGPNTQLNSDEFNLTPYFHYGFGLPIAQWIIGMRHGGTVELFSEVGKGTRAVITLPITQKGA